MSKQVLTPLILVVAVALCAGLVWLGPTAAEAVIRQVLGDEEGSVAAMDAIFTVVIFGTLLAGGIAGGWLAGRNALKFGRRGGSAAMLGLAIGLAGMALAVGYGWLGGGLTSGPAAGSLRLLLAGTLLTLLQAGSEEVYFRGWLQPVLGEAWGPAAGVTLAAAAFALLHMMGGARAPLTLVNLFLGGVLFGLLALRFGGIGAPVAGHFAWNWTEALLFGLDPNPGIGSFGAVLNLELSGSALWGGSEEGINASLAMTFALAAFIAPLLLLRVGPAEEAIPGAASEPGRSGPAPA